MGERYRRAPRHPIAKRYPQDPPPRIEMQVRRGAYDERQYEFDNNIVCNCFPRTSDLTIPSMFYDKISCPHKHLSHIQPAQETQFNYPWTADSIGRRKARGDDDELSERLSLISEEDDQLRFTPVGLHNRPPADILSIATAPPYWYKRETNPRDDRPPYTAPADESDVFGERRRAVSMADIRDPAYRTDESPTRQGGTAGGYRRNSRLSNRQFTGSYVDPKDGKVYKYNVNYDGTPKPQGIRRPQPAKKPSTAL